MKDWEIYERQIFDKLNEEFPDAEISKNQKIIGKFSKINRQIDILVISKSIGHEIKVVIDCKKFSKVVDIKTVESFIGMLDDVGAHVGIIITNEGFTKSAKNRVTGYTKDVKLKVVEFSKLDEFHFIWDYCEACSNIERPIHGEISWDKNEIIIDNKRKVSIIRGSCDYCGTVHYKCVKCGVFIEREEMNYMECGCGNQFELKEVYIGSGMTEDSITIKKK
ncbi:MAG: restriction endonuclease [Saprospiraceae bacterium]|nr:restriction endonuclease [Saprospiraceae bacterium]